MKPNLYDFDLQERPPYRGPNWPFLLILAAYASFFTWLIVRG